MPVARALVMCVLVAPPACASHPTPNPDIVLRHPPADPLGPPPDTSATAVFAMKRMWFGDVDPTGGSDQRAWRSIGFDVDEKATTKTSTDVCRLANGASRTIQEDGEGGIDNSFGANVRYVFDFFVGSATTPFSQQANASLSEGLVTNLVAVDGVGTGPSYSPMQAALLVAAPLGAKPAWSGTDAWPIDSASLAGGDAGAPLLAFPGSYMKDRVVAGEPPAGGGEIALGVVKGIPFTLAIRHVQVAMRVSADGMTATEGIVSGILPVDRLLAFMERFSAAISPSLCQRSAFESIAQQLRQSADILVDGTQDSSRDCDGISLGLGFEAVRVHLGSVAQVAPLGQTCDAGATP